VILDHIVIENFGAFRGRQEAELTTSPGRPIVLFGGMNGGGKTTLLDAIQLAFYGPRARLSNRGRGGYRDYLRDSIHRGADPGEGASITLRFRRCLDGESHSFELQRHWRLGVKGIEEGLRVLRDGLPDDILTEHWDETIASFLPVGIAHLFFFDGEQIKDLADGGHAAEIIGTGINSLLGVDLLERLSADLRVFERGVRKEQDQRDEDPVRQQIVQAEGEAAQIDRELERIALAEGAKVNEASRAAKVLRDLEERFQSAGGDLYLRHAELEAAQTDLERQKTQAEEELRELIAGPIPLGLVTELLATVAEQARHETRIRHARILDAALAERDQALMEALEGEHLDSEVQQRIASLLAADRLSRGGLAQESMILDADDQFPARVDHLRCVQIPQAEDRASSLTARIRSLDESLARVVSELERVPAAASIAALQRTLQEAQAAHAAKLAEIEELRARRAMLLSQQKVVMERIDRLGLRALDSELEQDEHARMLKHSARVRETLGRLRSRIVGRHTETIESLMLESFRSLLRKTDLVRDLRIDPATFAPTLTGNDGKPLPFDRLSAGERQLLATAMLWGLARASGRPIPTIIDTPLGRLDSSHRRNLVERYFPQVSHQVILLSTDEEIVGSYYEAIEPYVTTTYLLAPVACGRTEILTGYFLREREVPKSPAASGV